MKRYVGTLGLLDALYVIVMAVFGQKHVTDRQGERIVQERTAQTCAETKLPLAGAVKRWLR